MTKAEKGEQKANFYLLAIVAIVAIVGIVVLILQSTGSSLSSTTLSGQAFLGVKKQSEDSILAQANLQFDLLKKFGIDQDGPPAIVTSISPKNDLTLGNWYVAIVVDGSLVLTKIDYADFMKVKNLAEEHTPHGEFLTVKSLTATTLEKGITYFIYFHDIHEMRIYPYKV